MLPGYPVSRHASDAASSGFRTHHRITLFTLYRFRYGAHDDLTALAFQCLADRLHYRVFALTNAVVPNLSLNGIVAFTVVRFPDRSLDAVRLFATGRFRDLATNRIRFFAIRGF